jgi:hypothetical protein
MASIFTYDPELVRVSSPWLTPADSPKPSDPQPNGPTSSNTTPPSGLLADYGVTRLEAEPQEGPTEYKLHLLLRPRRTYSSSTTSRVKATFQDDEELLRSQPLRSGPVLARSNQSRQNRLEQLTTQLLWRLQQSSPYHASSISDLVLPRLPEAGPTMEPSRPEKLLAGLEESRGALYEIGVSDDGTFVGLTKDEMDESLTNLRAMAASLGCNVEVVRMVMVGDCEWHESSSSAESSISSGILVPKRERRESHSFLDSIEATETLRHQAQLWVAEALITPDLSLKANTKPTDLRNDVCLKPSPSHNLNKSIQEVNLATTKTTEQLRITLTGPTTSGKSSLLGTLSTATLDNGRGKSRLSLLKHRHEIVSGITSSVAQELIGYKDDVVINYASGNVASCKSDSRSYISSLLLSKKFWTSHS